MLISEIRVGKRYRAAAKPDGSRICSPFHRSTYHHYLDGIMVRVVDRDLGTNGVLVVDIRHDGGESEQHTLYPEDVYFPWDLQGEAARFKAGAIPEEEYVRSHRQHFAGDPAGVQRYLDAKREMDDHLRDSVGALVQACGGVEGAVGAAHAAQILLRFLENPAYAEMTIRRLSPPKATDGT